MKSTVLVLLAIASLFLISCATAPSTRHRVSILPPAQKGKTIVKPTPNAKKGCRFIAKANIYGTLMGLARNCKGENGWWLMVAADPLGPSAKIVMSRVKRYLIRVFGYLPRVRLVGTRILKIRYRKVVMMAFVLYIRSSPHPPQDPSKPSTPPEKLQRH